MVIEEGMAFKDELAKLTPELRIRSRKKKCALTTVHMVGPKVGVGPFFLPFRSA